MPQQNMRGISASHEGKLYHAPDEYVGYEATRETTEIVHDGTNHQVYLLPAGFYSGEQFVPYPSKLLAVWPAGRSGTKPVCLIDALGAGAYSVSAPKAAPKAAAVPPKPAVATEAAGAPVAFGAVAYPGWPARGRAVRPARRAR
jgi:hypothetical protein